MRIAVTPLAGPNARRQDAKVQRRKGWHSSASALVIASVCGFVPTAALAQSAPPGPGAPGTGPGTGTVSTPVQTTTPAAPITLDAFGQGWFINTGSTNSQTGFGTTRNYYTGTDGNGSPVFRGWAAFNIPTSVTGNTATLQIDTAGVLGNPELTLWSLELPVSGIPGATGATGVNYFNDLGSGTQYGSRSYSPAEGGQVRNINLNASAWSALTAASGSVWGIGFSVPAASSAPGSPAVGVFAGSGNNVKLVLSTVAQSSDITGTGSFLTSGLGSSVNPVFNGGTLTGAAPGSFAQNFTVTGAAGSAINANGNALTFSGNFTNAAAGTPGNLGISGAGSVLFTGSFGSQTDRFGGINNSGTVTIGGTGTSWFNGNTNSGTFSILQGATVHNALNNTGTFSNAGAYFSDLTNSTATGIVTNEATGVWTGNVLSNTTGASITNNGTWVGNANNAATLINAGTWNSPVGTNSSITTSGTFTNQSTGEVNVLLTVAGGTATNAGALNAGATVQAGATLTSTGTLRGSLNNSGTANMAGIAHGQMNNSGTFNVTGDLASNLSNFVNSGTGRLNVTGGNYTGLNVINNNSTAVNGVDVSAGRTLSAVIITNGPTSSLQNSGTITTSNRLDNSGTLTSTGTINGGIFGLRSFANSTANVSGTVNGDITTAGTFNITGNLTHNNGALTGGGTFNNFGTLNLTGATLTTGQLTNFEGATTNAAGAINGQVDNGGIFNVTGDLTSNNTGFATVGIGVLNVSGGNYTGLNVINHNSTAANGINVSANRTLGAAIITVGAGSSILNEGTITTSNRIDISGTLNTTGTIEGGTNGLRALTGSTVNAAGTINGPISNAGTFTVTGDLASNGIFTNTGRLTVNAGTTWSGLTGLFNSSPATDGVLINGTVTLAPNRVLTTNSGASSRIAAGGTLNGGFAVNFGATGTNAGTISGLASTSGTLNSTGQLLGGLTVNSGTSATANVSGTVNGAISNSRNLNVTGNLSSNGLVTNANLGVITVNAGAAWTGSMSFNNNGTNSNAFRIFGSVNTSGTVANTAAGAQLEIAAGGSLTAAGGISNVSGARITNVGTINSLVTNSGVLFSNISSSQLRAGLTNNAGAIANLAGTANGAISNAGTLNVVGNLASNGALSTSGTGTVTVNAGAAWTGLGTVNHNSTATDGLLINGSLALAAGQSLNLGTGSSVRIGATGALTVSDEMTGNRISGVTGSSLINDGTVTGGLVTTGSVTNNGTWSGIIALNAGGEITNNGTWTSTSGNFFQTVRGTLNNFGTMTGPVSVNPNFGGGAGLFVNHTTGVVNANTVAFDNRVSNGGTLDNRGTWNGATTVGFFGAGTLLNSGTMTGLVTVNAAGSLTSTGTLNTGLTNRGTAALAGTLNGAVNNSNSLTVTGNLASDNALTNSGTGTITVNAGAAWTGLSAITNTSTNAAGITVDGTLTTTGLLSNGAGSVVLVNSGGTLNAGNVSNAEGGVITVALGGTVNDALTNSGVVNNAGTYNGDVTNTGALAAINNEATGVWTGNVLSNDTGATITNNGIWNGTAQNLATLVNGSGASWNGAVTNLAGGTVTNAGSITGLVTNAGTLNSTGTLGGGLVNAAGATASISGVLSGAVSNSAALNLTDALSGIGAFRQTGTGVFNLAGFSTAIGSLAGSGSVQIGSGVLTLGGDNSSTSFGGGISGTGGLTKTGSGTLTLSGSNAFSGVTTVSAGTLALTDIAELGGTVINNATFTNAGRVNGSVTNNASLTSTATIAGGLTNAAGATAALQGFVSGTIGNSGTITLIGNLGGGAAMTQAASGTFDLAGFTATIGSLAGSGSVELGAGSLVLGTDGTSTSFDGVIGGTGSLIKLGAGTLTLSGANTYTGETSVDEGSLTLTAGGVIAGRVRNDADFVNAGTVTGRVVNLDTFTSTGSVLGGLSQFSGTSTLSGVLNGSISSAGTLIVNGNLTSNDFAQTSGTGPTQILAGARWSGLTGFTNASTNAAGLDIAGTLAVSGIVTNQTGAATIIASTGTLAAANMANLGTVNNTGTVTTAITNSRTIINNGTWSGNLSQGTGSATNAGSWNGSFLVNAGGTVTNSGTWNNATGLISGISSGLFDNLGTLSGGGINVIGTNARLNNRAVGVISLTSGAVLRIEGGGTLTNAGAITGNAQINAGGIASTLAGSSWNGALTVGANGSLTHAGTITGTVTNSGSLTSTGTLTGGLVNNASGTAALAGALVGPVSNSGAIRLTGTTTGIGAVTQGATGSIDLAGFSTSFGSLAGSGTVQLGAATLTLGSNGASTSFGGVIGGTGALAKTGAGTLTLTGANTFTGGTTVTGGGLTLAAGGVLAGPVTNLATLTNAGTVGGSVTNQATFSNAGTVSGNVANEATFSNAGTVNGNLTNLGTATNTGAVNGNVANQSALVSSGAINGTLTNAAGATASLGGTMNGDVANAGTITLTGDTAGIGLFDQAAGGSFDLAGFSTAIGTLSGAGQIALGNATLTTGSSGASSLFGGVIGGTGALAKTGAGTLTLTGANTFTGGTTVTGGGLTLAAGGVLAGAVSNEATFSNAGTVNGNLTNLGNATNTGTVNGNVANQSALVSSGAINGSLTNTAGATASLGGTMNGDVANAGTITLTGDTTGIGLFDQAAGGSFDLAGFSTAIGTLSGAGSVVLGGARLTIGSGGASSLFGGLIGGTGALVKTGAGTFVLSGANTYAGGTTISGGVLQLGDGGAGGSIIGPVVNNGALVVNRSDGLSFADIISGTGMFVQSGTGTTTLTGANTYTGGTLVSGGRLVGTTTSLRGLIQINAGAALEFAQTAAGTFAGSLLGAGLFEKTGAGLLTLTGNSNAFTGATSVRAGELRVNGGLAGSVVTVGSGARLSGTGVIGGLIAQSGSTIAPGTSPGVLGVAGNVTLQPGSTSVFEVSAAGPSDLILATGTASLGGTAALINLGGTYGFGSQITLVQADGGRSGTFANVTGLEGFGIRYRPELVYVAGQARLRMAPNTLANIAGTAALTANQRSVVSRIDGAVAAGYNPDPLFNIYSLPAAQLPGAFDQLSGEIYATAAGVGIEQERLVREAVLGRINAVAAVAHSTPEAAKGIGAWGQLFGGWGDGESDGNAAAFEADRMGFVTGVDIGGASENGSWRAGLFGMRVQSDVTIAARGSRGEVQQAGGGAYASISSGGFTALVSGYLAEVDLRAFRSIALPGFADDTVGTTEGTGRQAFAELSYTLAAGEATVRPFVNGAIGSFKLDGLTERGGAAALTMRAQRYDTGSVTAGLDAMVPVGKRLSLAGTLAGRAQLGDRDPQALLALAAAPQQAFAVEGVQLDKLALAARLDATLKLEDNLQFSVGYTGLIGSTITDHGARATLHVQF